MLELEDFYIEKYNHDGYLARLQFDKAVNYFGIRVENLLSERDKNFKPKYTIEGILADDREENNKQDVISKMSAFGHIKDAFRVRKSRKRN